MAARGHGSDSVSTTRKAEPHDQATAHHTHTSPTRTPAQRAQEAVDVLTRRVERLRKQHIDAMAALDALAADIQTNQARLDYARNHPDLPARPTTDTAKETTK